MAPYQTLVEKFTGLPINALIQGLSGLTGRPASAEPLGPHPLSGDPTGRYAPGFMQQRFAAPPAPQLPPPGQGVTPIVRGDDDQYRQLLSQYGALSKAGKQQEAEKLGMDIWQKKYGATPMGQPGGAVGTYNPLMERTFGYQAGQGPTAIPGAFNIPQGFDVAQSFSGAANAIPAPPMTQGQAVSAPYQEAMSQAFDKTNPMNLVSQQQPVLDESIGEKVRAFLGGKGTFGVKK